MAELKCNFENCGFKTSDIAEFQDHTTGHANDLIPKNFFGKTETLEIIKKRDEFPVSIEVSNDNAKGEPKITIKTRHELPDGFTKEQLEAKVQMVVEVYNAKKKELA